MTILAIDSSTRRISVALLAQDNRIESCELSATESGSANLIPRIRDLAALAHVSLRQLQTVAVGRGPGSFTGLRLGIVTAKTLAYACRSRLVGIDTPELLAWQAARLSAAANQIWTVQDAQRGEYYTAKYQVFNANRLTCLVPPALATREAFLSGLCRGDLITGPAAGGLCGMIDHLGVKISPESAWSPGAEQLIRLVQSTDESERIADRDTIDAEVWQLRPNYIRPSAAEERKAIPPVRDLP